MNKVEELVERGAIILYKQCFATQDFYECNPWEALSKKEQAKWKWDAKQILSHPDLALIVPWSYSDKTPTIACIRHKSEWCGVVPLAKVLNEEE